MMFSSNIDDQLLPTYIHVLEEYVYKARVSGVRQIQMENEPSGLIEVIIPLGLTQGAWK